MELARRYGMDGFAEIESVAVLQEARMRALSKDPRVIQAMNCTRFVINALRILGGLKRFILWVWVGLAVGINTDEWTQEVDRKNED